MATREQQGCGIIWLRKLCTLPRPFSTLANANGVLAHDTRKALDREAFHLTLDAGFRWYVQGGGSEARTRIQTPFLAPPIAVPH
ncbi:hypothetical protein CTheo_3703 [Ceratobasidium theobromae]|uniref:Uncharacterized protein n=1 Tax=Ceratobasidium theobromae TaxID=1582974 RepID=A0A5N5QMP8_9AGAM|nr:hypothetical protein CTheo_3703 [Ceratobasidium theobromae]